MCPDSYRGGSVIINCNILSLYRWTHPCPSEEGMHQHKARFSNLLYLNEEES
jgi:hypothetical protein